MEEDMFEGASDVMLGTQQLPDGTWRAALIVKYEDGREPLIRVNDASFATAEEAEAWQQEHVRPLLERDPRLVQAQTALELAHQEQRHPNRPQGVRCTRWENTEDDRVYCAKPATWHIPLPKGIEDEYTCDEHAEELREQSPAAARRLRRVH